MIRSCLLLWFCCVVLAGCADFPEIPLAPDNGVSPEEVPGASDGAGGGGSGTGGGEAGDPGPSDFDEDSETSEGEGEEDEAESIDPEDEPTSDENGGEVVINELYYDAPGSDTDGVLFVELFGTPEMVLGGYQIVFINGDGGAITDLIELPAESRMGADGFFVIADGRTDMLDTTVVAGSDLIDNFDPQNGPDGVQLLDAAGRLLDSLVYGEGAVAVAENGFPLGEGSFAPDVAGGHSLSRHPAGWDSDDNAVDFVENTLPSPGTAAVTPSE